MDTEFRLLGPIEVWGNGQPLRLGGVKQRALLAILLLHANRVIGSERLVDLLWGDDAPESALNSLQVHLSQLRRTLEPERTRGTPSGMLVHRPAGYMLAVRPDQLDMHRFEQLAHEGRQLLTDGQPERAAPILHAALALWRGPALADFADELFAVGARARLEELRITTLEDRIQADLALGQPAELVAELQALATLFPLRERLSGHLMLCLYLCGRQAEASEVYQRTRRQLVDELGLEPGPELQGLLTRILDQDPELGQGPESILRVRPRARTLPLQLTSFIGRQDDLSGVKEQLGAGRLITLLGPAGIGKTRLALRVVSQCQDGYSDGVWFIDLAQVMSPDMVPQCALAALSIEQQGGTSLIESIVRRLASQHVLLLIDNCEHVIEAAADLALTVLERCAGVTILATSRERLNVPGERVWRVDPLAVPPQEAEPSPQALVAFESVQLYVDRAQAGERLFALTEHNATSVAQLCRRLDGLPLALELAAASATVATPNDLLALLSERLWLPARPTRGTPPRQQTLEAALDWSFQLLTPVEQTLLRRLSVFAGHFTSQAVEQVCTDERLPRAQMLAQLSALSDKSLVATHESFDGAARFRLLHTLRQYAAGKLAASHEADESARRHARYLLMLASASADAVHGPDLDAWMRQMEEAHADLTAALTWSKKADPELCLRLAAAAAPYWEDRGYLTEGRQWLEAALERADAHSPGRPDARLADARLALLQNDFPASRAQLERALEAAEARQDEPLKSNVLRTLGLLAALTGERARGTAWLQQSLEIAERLGSNEGITHTLHNLGQCARVLGDDFAARTYHTRALAVSRVLQNHRIVGLSLLNLGTLALRRSDLDESEDQLRESLQLSARSGARVLAAAAVGALGFLAAQRGDCARGLRLVSAVVAFAEASGIHFQQTAAYWFGDDMSTRMERLRSGLPEHAASSAWDAGRHLSLNEAISEALTRSPIAVA